MTTAATQRPAFASVLRNLPSWAGAVLFGCVTALLGALRAGDESYWLDEAATAAFVRRSFGGLLHFVWAEESSMGPYYLSLWAWSRAFPGEAGMRMFSVAGGAVAVVLLVLLAEKWFGRAIAATAGVVLMTNPFFLRYLTELRAYSWLMAISVALTWVAYDFARGPTRRRGLVMGGLIGLGVAMNFFFAAWVISLGAVLMATRALPRPPRRAVATALAASAAVLVPFLHALTQNGHQIDWIPATTGRGAVEVASATLGGILPGLPLAAGLAAALIDTAWRWKRTPGRMADPPTIRVLVLAAAVAGPSILLLVSFVKPIFIARYLAPSAPFIALGAALGFAAIGQRLRASGRTIALVFLALLCVGDVVMSGPFSDEPRVEDPRAAVEFVLGRIEPGDLIAIDGPGALSIERYLGARPDIDPAWVEPVDDRWGDIERLPSEQVEPQLREAPRVFVFIWDEASVSPVTRRLARSARVDRTYFGKSMVWVIS